MVLMPKTLFLTLLLPVLILCSCAEKQVCPTPGSDKHYLSQEDLVSLNTPVDEMSPTEVSINGKTILVDQLVTGPLCIGQWAGTVYVGCDVQVMEWEETPLFLKDCDLSIEPGTVVYVAYHNDSAYYNGCSCHTGETAGP
jgi:hypothetical protein